MNRPIAFKLEMAVIIAFIFASFSAFTIAPAGAAEKSPKPKVTNSKGAKSESNIDYRTALERYRADKATYNELRRGINKVFKIAITGAKRVEREANLTAQTQMQKRKNMVGKQESIMAAIVTRDSAIEALGEPPVRPAGPRKFKRP
jgi:hypothetical protein|tara:strand:+ start:2721 stop:3158 length:438 start_codon:yes stop_codon:yes gene_type:complete